MSSVAKEKTDNVFLCLYCIGYMALTILPALKYSVSYTIVGTYSLIPVALSFFKFNKLRTSIFIVAFLGILCGALIWLLDNSGIKEVINTPINYLRFFMPCLLFNAVFKSNNWVRWVIWVCSAIIVTFVAYETISALNTNDMVARLLANGDTGEELSKLRMDNIGGFGFCYAIGFTFPLWVTAIVDTNIKWIKAVSIVLAVATFLFVLRVQYMILLLMCFFTVLLAIVYRPGNALKKMFGLIVVFLSFFILPYALRALTHFDLGSQISAKINNIAMFLDGSVTISSTTSRIEKYQDAFYEFIKSPIWGTVASEQAGRCHSTWLRLGCTSGIFGISTYAFMLFASYKNVSAIIKENKFDTIPFIVTFITLVVLAFVNPIDYSYEISFVVFLFVPLTMLLFSKKGDVTDAKMET